MPTQWHDINEPGIFSHKKKESQAPRKEVETAPAEPVAEKKPEIKLIKGTWSEGADGFEFNKKCKAHVEASFIKDPQSRKITLKTFVRYKGAEEDLNQNVDTILDSKGTGECDITLYYGQKYKSAQDREDPETTCIYVFKAGGKNCTNELESEQLEMPFMPDCLKEREKSKADANKSASEDGMAGCTGDCEHCENQAECFPSSDTCAYSDKCKIKNKCTKDSKQASSQSGAPVQGSAG